MLTNHFTFNKVVVIFTAFLMLIQSFATKYAMFYCLKLCTTMIKQPYDTPNNQDSRNNEQMVDYCTPNDHDCLLDI